LPPEGQADRNSASRPDVPTEIAFLSRHGVAPAVLAEATALAFRQGVPADEAMLKNGLLDEDAFYRALAAELGLPYVAAGFRAAPEARFPHAVLCGLGPLDASAGDVRFALAPTGPRVGWLLDRAGRFGPGLGVTSPSALRDAVIRAQGGAIARLAAHGLAAADPAASYRDGMSVGQGAALVIAALATGFFGALAPEALFAGFVLVFGTLFLGMAALRLGAVLERVPVEPRVRAPRAHERDLPVYTIVVPLYREAQLIPRLLAALEALDYPAAKKDVKIVVEADDGPTAAALGRLRLPGYVEVIVAPPGAPRTKPRALNVALPLARGAFLVVYDAEDVPDPGQLRLAVATFARAAPDVACLQARLVIDNTRDDWIARLFTIEYAALFDVVNPGLAAMGFPVPLGGTSNHFRTEVLRDLHGWDSWNVTEDADLGIRLALAGYRVLDLPSSTLEEAPAGIGRWMRQRSRWMKGFVQVVVTHSRRPWCGARSLGPVRFFGAVTMTLGTVLSALGYPLFAVLAVLDLAEGRLATAETLLEAVQASIGLTVFGAGCIAMLAPAVAGLARRGWWTLMPAVLLLPLYYALVSVAAWRGLAELLSAPFHWHKTDHGLARTSRTGLVTAAREDPSPLRPAVDSG
jgi:glycosyltransferase XagB